LGREAFIRFTWSPISDLQFVFGAGTFIPVLGNVWKDGKPQWKLDFTAVLAIW
jgi:hypothetical protein